MGPLLAPLRPVVDGGIACSTPPDRDHVRRVRTSPSSAAAAAVWAVAIAIVAGGAGAAEVSPPVPARSAPTRFVLSAAQLPGGAGSAGNSIAYGLATAALDVNVGTGSSLLAIAVNYTGISVTAAGIYNGSLGEASGTKLADLPAGDFDLNGASRLTLSASTTALVSAGLTHVRAASLAYPNGELRAPLGDALLGTAVLSRSRTVSPVAGWDKKPSTDIAGFATAVLAPDASTLDVHVRLIVSGPGAFDLPNFSGMHVHIEAPFRDGPVGCHLAAPNAAGVSHTRCAADATLASAFLQGKAYVAVHTPSSPVEARGSLFVASQYHANMPAVADMTSSAVTPPAVGVSANARGAGAVLVHNQLTSAVAFVGLSGAVADLILLHVHGPASPGEHGVVIVTLPLRSCSQVMFSLPTDPKTLNLLLKGFWYYAAHTAAHLAGLLRGQLTPLGAAVYPSAALRVNVGCTSDASCNGHGTCFAPTAACSCVSPYSGNLCTECNAGFSHVGTTCSKNVDWRHAKFLDSNYALYWRRGTGAASDRITIRVEVRGTSWVGFGISLQGRMIKPEPSDAVVLRPTLEVPSHRVRQYDLVGMAPSLIVPDAKQDLSETAWSQSGGITTMQFERAFDTGDAGDRAISADPAVKTKVIFAYGVSNDFAFHARGYGSTEVDFASTAVVTCVEGTCGKHGSCGAIGGCACQPGYKGDKCDACEANLASRGEGAEQVCVAGKAVLQLVLNQSLSKDMVIGTANSAERNEVTKQFEADLGVALGVSRSRVFILSMAVAADGTTVATVGIRDTGDGTDVPGEPLVLEAVSRLRADLTNSSSALFARRADGTRPVTWYIDGTATLERFIPVYTEPIEPSDHTTQLHPKLSLSWSVSDGVVEVVLTLKQRGWIGFGFSTIGRMVGGDVVIGKPVENTVREYAIGEYSLAGVQLANVQTIKSGASIVQEGDTTRLRYRRPMNPQDRNKHTINPSGNTVCVFAFGASNTFAQHEGRGSVVIDFTTGAVGSATDTSLVAIHATLMLVAWMVLIPLGVFIASFERKRSPQKGPRAWWFVRHRAIQSLALVVAVVGVIVAAVMVARVRSSHANFFHSQLGTALMVLGLLQPVNAYFRPHPTDLRGAVPLKRKLWSLWHRGCACMCGLLAVYTVHHGMRLVDLDEVWRGVHAAFVVVLVFAYTAKYIQLPFPEPDKTTMPSRRGARAITGVNPLFVSGTGATAGKSRSASTTSLDSKGTPVPGGGLSRVTSMHYGVERGGHGTGSTAPELFDMDADYDFGYDGADVHYVDDDGSEDDGSLEGGGDARGAFGATPPQRSRAPSAGSGGAASRSFHGGPGSPSLEVEMAPRGSSPPQFSGMGTAARPDAFARQESRCLDHARSDVARQQQLAAARASSAHHSQRSLGGHRGGAGPARHASSPSPGPRGSAAGAGMAAGRGRGRGHARGGGAGRGRGVQRFRGAAHVVVRTNAGAWGGGHR